MRDSDLAVAPAEGSLTFVLSVLGVQDLSMTATGAFNTSVGAATVQGTDLLIGAGDRFAVGNDGDSLNGRVTNSGFREDLGASVLAGFANNFESSGDIQIVAADVFVVPLGGISSETLDAQNPRNSFVDGAFNDDVDQFLRLPSFLGRL